MQRFAGDGDETRFMAHDQRFHEIVLLASGNQRLAQVIGGLRDHVRFRGASTVGRSRDLAAILVEHTAILHALREPDAARAAEAMRHHIRQTARLLLSQEGAAGALLEWED